MLPGRGDKDDALGFLLARLLAVFGAAMLLGVGGLAATDLYRGSTDWLIWRVAVILAMLAAGAALFLRQEWELHQLRVIELVMFGVATAYLAAQTYGLGVAELGQPGVVATTWNSALWRFALLMVAYGVFVPNKLWRAVIVIAAIGATPLLVAASIRVRHPELQAAFDSAVADSVLDTATLLGASGGVAVFAAFVTYNLFDFAYEQRQQTFYDLEERIGAGGMGEVWKARHRTLARPTAVKLIREDKVDSADKQTAQVVLQRFAREARTTAGLRSPHTVDVYDFGVTADGHFYYAMEYLDGLDLEVLAKDYGCAPPERVVHLMLQACDSLADAHARGYTHRDIKPANLHLSRKGTSGDFVTLLDFGLVKTEVPIDDSGELTAEGTTAGTPAYMAPEMALGQGDVDGRADLYALGCVAYWLLTRKQVFEAETGVALIVEHVKTPPTPPSQRTEMPIPAELEAIIMKCLEKDPADRFQAATELARALRAVPLPEPWTPTRAAEWWDLHRPSEAAA